MRGSSVVRGAEVAGLSAAGVAGLQFALDPARGRTAVPVRSALVGTVLAVAMVVVTLTFASSLNTLVSHPALYGWDWNYMLNPSDDVPPQTLTVLDHDPDVAAWAGSNLANAQIDGQSFPILLSSTNAALSPPILSGHALEAKSQIVLGAATLSELHKHVGNTVVVSYGTRGRTGLRPSDPSQDRRDSNLAHRGVHELYCRSHLHGHWRRRAQGH